MYAYIHLFLFIYILLYITQLGAKVIIACRDTEKGHTAAQKIQDKVPNATIIVKHLDLAAFSSIRSFANDILKHEPFKDVIHVLCVFIFSKNI